MTLCLSTLMSNGMIFVYRDQILHIGECHFFKNPTKIKRFFSSTNSILLTLYLSIYISTSESIQNTMSRNGQPTKRQKTTVKPKPKKTQSKESIAITTMIDSFTGPSLSANCSCSSKVYWCLGMSETLSNNLTLSVLQNRANYFDENCSIDGTLCNILAHPNGKIANYMHRFFFFGFDYTPKLNYKLNLCRKEVLQQKIDGTSIGAHQLCNKVINTIASESVSRSWGTGSDAAQMAETHATFVMDLVDIYHQGNLNPQQQNCLFTYGQSYNEVREGGSDLASRWDSKPTLVEEVTASTGHFQKKHVALLVANHVMFHMGSMKTIKHVRFKVGKKKWQCKKSCPCQKK